MTQPYSLSIFWSDEDEAYVALCPEFPGFSAFGDSYAEAVAEAETALKAMLELCEEDGEELPQPRRLPEHSGQFRVRIPRSLHTGLVLEAERQGVSLNTLVQTYLAQGITQAAACDCFEEMRKHFAKICSEVKRSWQLQGNSYVYGSNIVIQMHPVPNAQTSSRQLETGRETLGLRCNSWKDFWEYPQPQLTP